MPAGDVAAQRLRILHGIEGRMLDGGGVYRQAGKVVQQVFGRGWHGAGYGIGGGLVSPPSATGKPPPGRPAIDRGRRRTRGNGHDGRARQHANPPKSASSTGSAVERVTESSELGGKQKAGAICFRERLSHTRDARLRGLDY